MNITFFYAHFGILRDVQMARCYVVEAIEEVMVGLTFFSTARTQHSPTAPLFLLQIYNQTDGSYMRSPEMSPLYSFVTALAQTDTAITFVPFIPASFFSLLLSLVQSFPSSLCLPSSARSISISLPSLSFFIFLCFCLTQNKCAHTHRRTCH